jgi:hypothetical protein
MSTLVSILLAIVLNTLSGGGTFKQESIDISQIAVVQCEDRVQKLECHYIIKDEQLFHTK